MIEPSPLHACSLLLLDILINVKLKQSVNNTIISFESNRIPCQHTGTICGNQRHVDCKLMVCERQRNDQDAYTAGENVIHAPTRLIISSLVSSETECLHHYYYLVLYIICSFIEQIEEVRCHIMSM